MKRGIDMSKNSFENSGFARLYTWITKAKLTMGIFFMMHVILFLFFGLIIDGIKVSLDFYSAIEMLFACFFIGLLQQALIPQEKFTRVRCALWIVSSTSVTLLFGLVFQWFKLFPAWCFPVFISSEVIGMLFMILSYYLELNRETKYLNRKLDQFRSNKPEREG
jgi:hypothetical protein